MTRRASGDAPSDSGLENALEWAKLPPEHLRAALRALEPELSRQHQERMADRRNSYRLSLMGLVAGFVLCAGMLTGSVIVGVEGQPWLAGVLAGPSMIGVIGVFVLRQVDTKTSSTATSGSLGVEPPRPVAPSVDTK